jgi:hypothetical protein
LDNETPDSFSSFIVHFYVLLFPQTQVQKLSDSILPKNKSSLPREWGESVGQTIAQVQVLGKDIGLWFGAVPFHSETTREKIHIIDGWMLSIDKTS